MCSFDKYDVSCDDTYWDVYAIYLNYSLNEGNHFCIVACVSLWFACENTVDVSSLLWHALWNS